MNSLQWMAIYFALLALWANVMIGETVYRFWIIELSEKERLYAEMCERLGEMES